MIGIKERICISGTRGIFFAGPSSLAEGWANLTRRTVRGGDDRSCLELGGGAEETLPPLLVDAGCHKGASQ